MVESPRVIAAHSLDVIRTSFHKKTVQHMMDKWRRDALVHLENDLKIHLGLTEVMSLLEKPAGGFMTAAERMSVEDEKGRVSQVDKIIKILRQKGNEEFEIFLEILRKSGNKVWASCLAKSADQFQQEYANCGLSFSTQVSQAPDRQTMEEGYIHNMRHSACATPPGRAISSPPYASTQLPQSPPKHFEYLQPSMDRGNCIMLPPMPVDLQVISSILLEQKVYITGIATELEPESYCVQVYSLNEFRWSKLKVAPNYNAPSAAINGRITLIGGRISENSITNGVYSWFQEEEKWKSIIPSMPKARLESGICHHEGLLLVMGGVEDTTQTEPVDTVVVYNFSKNRWVTVRALQLPKGLRSPHVVMFKEHVYLIGGGTTYPAPLQHGVNQYNQEAWRACWSMVKEAVIEAEDTPKQGEHTGAADEEPSKRVKSVWRKIADPLALRPTVVSSKDFLMAVGGVNSGGRPQSGIYAFIDDRKDDEKNVDCCGSWRLMGNMSVGRYRHAVVPLGSLGATLFIAGGYVLDNPVGDETHAKTASVELVTL